MLPLFVQTVLVILGVLCFGYSIKRVVKQKKLDCLLFMLGGTVLVFAEQFSWIDGYWLSVIKFMFRTLKHLNSEGLTVVVVEQNARLALQVADRGYVLDTGAIVAEGTAAELADKPEIKAAYLGA